MYTETDPAIWGTITEEARGVLIDRGLAAFQNRGKKYPASVRDGGLGGRVRSLTNDIFECALHNGEKVTREWLVYSPSTGNVFCFPCMLFSLKKNQLVSGFSDWKHPERLLDHEKSCQHSECMLTFHHRSVTGGKGAINAELVQQLEGEKRYWREVLKRVIAVIQFLSERGLAFRGDNELLGSPHNGNFLGMLEVISKFDPFLAEHISKYGQRGRGIVSYLSSTTCEDLIQQMGEKLKATIAAEIREAKYFSLIVDSTPDLSHTDQLTFVFRFVSKEGSVVERFLGFEPIESHRGKSG